MKNNYLFVSILLTVFFFATGKSLHGEVLEGNDNNTMLNLVCPDNVHISCEDEIWYLNQYGTAQYHDGYGWHNAGTPVTHYNLSMCNTGTITRTWSVEDPYWNWHSCTQVIYVSGGYNSFDESDINWPEDIILTGCNPNTHPNYLPYGQDKPRWNNVACSMIGVSYTDHLYTVNNNCKTIRREWTVLDWCQEGTDWYGNPTGQWTYWQEIKIMNNDIPYVNCPDDIYVVSNNCADAKVTVPSLYVHPSSCGGDFTITNDSPYAYNNGANISGIYPVGYTTVKYTIKYGCGLKKHCTVKVHVKSEAEPTPYCYGSITLVLMGIDNDGDGINDDGMVELWAKDLDKGSFVNCGYNKHLKFSFSSNPYDNVKVFTCDDVGVNYVDMWVTSSSGAQNYCTVKVNIQNNAANIVDCEPDDNGGNGGDGNGDGDGNGEVDTTQLYDIAGKVKTQVGQPVGGVRIDLADGLNDTIYNITYLDTTEVITLDSFVNSSGAVIYILNIDTVYTTEIDTIINDFQMTDYTDQWGGYLFDSVGIHGTLYTITATLDSNFVGGDYGNGINSADLQLLMDYLLGDTEIRTNAGLLAADVDGDGEIDFEDLKLLYRYVIGEIDELPKEEWIVVSNDKLNNSTDILNEEELNVSLRIINGAPENDVHFTVIQIGNILSGNSGMEAANDNEDDIVNVLRYVEDVEELKEEIFNLTHKIGATASPNPFRNTFEIQYTSSDLEANTILEIYNVNGKLIQSNNIITNQGTFNYNVNLESSQPGMYIYRIIDGNKITSGKVIKI